MPAPPQGQPAKAPGRAAFGLARRALDTRARPMPEGARTALLLVAFGLFLALAAWAWTHRPSTDVETNWWLLLAVLALTPLGLLLKAVEYSTAAAILDQRPKLRESLQISVLSSAANLLPIPGSALVTMRSLSEAGSTYGRALTSTAAVSLTWVATSLLYGGVGIALASGSLWVALAITASGLILLGITARMMVTLAGAARTPRLWWRTVVVETAFILTSMARFWLILRAMGISATVAQAVALTIAGTLATALAFFPSGLGIREAIAAAISPLVDLDPEAGLLTAVFDRVFWLAILAMAAGVIVVRRQKVEPSALEPTPDDQPVLPSVSR